MEINFAPVLAAGAGNQAGFDELGHKADGTVVFHLETIAQLANRQTLGQSTGAEGEESLILLRGKVMAGQRFLAKTKKLAETVAEIGQGADLGLGRAISSAFSG